MTKEDAEHETIRRWHELPTSARETYEQAEAFAQLLDAELEFRTMTRKWKLIAAWLIRDIDRLHHDETGVEDVVHARAA